MEHRPSPILAERQKTRTNRQNKHESQEISSNRSDLQIQVFSANPKKQKATPCNTEFVIAHNIQVQPAHRQIKSFRHAKRYCLP